MKEDIDNEIKRIIKEELVSILKPKLTEGVRGEELMNQLEDLARDTMTIGEPELGKAYAYLYDRINQSARDIDVDAEMLNDFLYIDALLLSIMDES